MIKKLNALIEQYQKIADDLYPNMSDSRKEAPDHYDQGKSDGISEVLDELRKIVDGVR